MKRICQILSLVLLVVMLSSILVGCVTPGNNDDPTKEQIDTTRTQLYVYNFNGGYGSDWIVAAKKRYEELHKDDVYEEGKKGVQIMINPQKTTLSTFMSNILDNRDEIYFTEYAYYYTLLSEGILGDITDAVKGDLSELGDPSGSTIEGKLTNEQKNYFGISENGETKYYGIPHYSGYSGLIYNIDLFEEKGYYFLDDRTDVEALLDNFVASYPNGKRSAGPDGKYGTSDDGLPATYDEFFMLCDFIASDGNTPVCWTGANYKDYLNNFLQALVADYEGLDNMMLNYTLEGTATDLGKVSGSSLTVDSTPTTITTENAYELKRQAGKYYGLSFLEKLAKTSDYHNSLAFNNSYSHMNAQEDFLYAGHDGGETKPIAMLCDGVWWQSEANQTFDDMVASSGSEFSASNRNFGWMPLPKATSEKVGESSTLFDHIYSICFMKANVAEWKKPLALDFIKFVHTDESLVEYTTITNTPKAFNYTMNEAQKSALSPYGRSLMEIKERSDIVYPYSSNSVYKNKQGQFSNDQQLQSIVKGTQYTFSAEAIHDGNVSSGDYFNGMYEYYKKNWKILFGIK